jgi:DNA-binding MarR family transcriptional regulator
MVLVHVTKAGSRVADTVRRKVHRGEAEWMGTLSEHERAQLTELLGELQRHLARRLSR